jgi:hypothetical protein
MVGHAGQPGVYIGAAQALRVDDFTGGRLHQLRPAQEYGAGVGDDHGFIAHGRDVGPAGGA